MSKIHYISVILPLKLEWEPCYSIPHDMAPQEIHVGDRVKVIFANKEYFGVVSATGIEPETDIKKIKPVLSVEKDMERILPQEIELWKAVAGYYLCTTGEVYKAAYPHGKTSLEEARAAAKSKVRERREKLMESIRLKLERLEARLAKKEEQLEKARKDSTRASYMEEIRKLKDDIENAQSALVAGHVHAEVDKQEESAIIGVDLTDAQAKAYEEVRSGFRKGRPVMLHGVTGSGKTEIYMKLAHEAMDGGKNVLYLLPEIALSRQLEDRLHAHFGERLLVFHSGESAASRRNTAEAIRRAGEKGESYIVLGTRSSIFLPHNNLGLIIVDEEHDTSYKQDSPAPRYNGRDSALMLHRIHGCSIILGSATPSLEELYNCQTGRHELVELKERFHGSDDSAVEIINTNAERRKNGMVGNFSRKLIEQINMTLERGEQVMILRSRRAWAPVMQCTGCGEIVRCPHCNVSLSYHKTGRMQCHYCGHTEPYIGKCMKCNSPLMTVGAGTQKIEEEAAALFPEARIARLDSDTAQNRTYEARIIRDFSNGDIDILIGTQIVTKGFDFSDLSLVAVIAADSLLGMQDFRADEKALQLMEQFRGRCGRRGRKGLFMIQTSQPEHPIYQSLVHGETYGVNTSLLLERKDFDFPPFTRIIELTIKDRYEDRAERMAAKLSHELERISPVTGPYSPVVDKIADNHIRTIRISLRKDRQLHENKEAVRKTVTAFEKNNRYDGHIIMNVDPS